MNRETIVSAQLTSEHYLRSPIGMEVARKVTVKIPGTCVNILLMGKYKQLVQQFYIEPKNEEILGLFLQANETIDRAEAQPVLKKAKVKRKNKPIRQLTDKNTYAIYLRNKESQQTLKLPRKDHHS